MYSLLFLWKILKKLVKRIKFVKCPKYFCELFRESRKSTFNAVLQRYLEEIKNLHIMSTNDCFDRWRIHITFIHESTNVVFHAENIFEDFSRPLQNTRISRTKDYKIRRSWLKFVITKYEPTKSETRCEVSRYARNELSLNGWQQCVILRNIDASVYLRLLDYLLGNVDLNSEFLAHDRSCRRTNVDQTAT